jgi:YDG domain/MBG domain (YGX type)/Fibronectin type III domain
MQRSYRTQKLNRHKLLQLSLMGILLLASSISAGLVVDDSLNRYSLYGRKLMKMERAASTSQGGWIGSDSLVQIDVTDTLRSTVTSGKDFQINNGGDWIWGDVRVARDLGSGAMYNDSIMGKTYVGRNLIMAQLNILKGRVYTGGQLTVGAWNHNYFNGSDFFNNSVSTTFSSPFSVSGLTWGARPEANPYSAWSFPDTTFSASSISIATSFTTPKDASGKYRWTCGSNAVAGGSDLVALHVCSTNDTILPPGNYGDANLWYGSTLFLDEGAYSFNNVTLPPSSGTDSTRLLARQPNGMRTVILVKGKLDGQASSRLNVIAPENYARGYGTDATHFAGGTLMIYAEQPVSLGVGLELWATLVVPHHSVTLNDQVHLFGQILADSILVKNKFKGTDGAFVPFRPGQKITFAAVTAQKFGTTPTFSATSSSGLAVSFTSSTTEVCNITSSGALTFATTGTCTINADQLGNAYYVAAPTVSRSFSVNAVVPGVPATVTAMAGNGEATVSFTAPTFTGGASISGYTVASDLGGFTAAGATSPLVVTGLNNGTAYTFTVKATNSEGSSAASVASGIVTPIAPQAITFAGIADQVFGNVLSLSATSTSSLAVNFSSVTTGVCTITSEGALTFLTKGTCTIDANQAGNAAYLSASTVSHSFTIQPRPVLVKAFAQTKVYSSSDPALPHTDTGLVGTDVLTGTLSRVGGDTVGKYAITQGTLSAGGNYALTYAGDSLSITKAPLTNTGAVASNKVYDGTTSASVTGATLSGIVNSDNVTLVLGTATFATKDMGTAKAVTVTGSTLSGTKAGNYSLTEIAGLAANITAKPMLVTAAAKSKVYGAVDPALTHTDTGLVNGDVVSGALSRAVGDTVGKYAITQGTITAGNNYALAFEGDTLSVTPAPLTITASDTFKEFAATNPVFSSKVSGLVNGETDTVVKGLVFDVNPGTGADNLTIVPSGATAVNYAITYVNGKLTIHSPVVGISARVVAPTSRSLDAFVPNTFAKPALSGGRGDLGLGVQSCGEDNSCQSVDVLLPQAGSIEVGIYDNLGTQVIAWNTVVNAADLVRLPVTVDGRRQAHMSWNLRSASGRAVPEGVYLWKVKVALDDGTKLENVFRLGVKK